MTTVTCPHTKAAVRTCPGCKTVDQEAERCPNPYCDGSGAILVSAEAVTVAEHRIPGACEVGPHPPRPCTVTCEAGEIEGRVYSDSDGDAGVIGGIRNFFAVEDVSTTCGCVLTDREEEKVEEELIEKGSEPSDPSDAFDFPY